MMQIAVVVTMFTLLTGCGREMTPGGITYWVDDPNNVPADLPQQIDAAWQRDLDALKLCHPGHKLGLLHDELEINVMHGIIDMAGKRYYGLSYMDAKMSYVALIEGRIPATAHEMWHQILAQIRFLKGDYNHTDKCWKLVDGDTK